MTSLLILFPVAQIRFSEHLRSRGFPSPKVVRTKDRTFTGETSM